MTTSSIYTLIFKTSESGDSIFTCNVKYDFLKNIPRLIKSLNFGGLEATEKKFIIVQPYLTKEIVMTYMQYVKWRRDNIKASENFQHFLTWYQQHFKNTDINITTYIQSLCFNSGDPSGFNCNPFIAALAYYLDDELFFEAPFYGAIVSFEKYAFETPFEVGKIYIPFCFKDEKQLTEYICEQLNLMGQTCHVVDEYNSKYKDLQKSIKVKEEIKKMYLSASLGDAYSNAYIGNNTDLKKVIKELKKLKDTLENLQHTYTIYFHDGIYKATTNTNSLTIRIGHFYERIELEEYRSNDEPIHQDIHHCTMSFNFKYSYRGYASTKTMTESNNFTHIPNIVQAQICEDYIKYINESRGNPHRKLHYFCIDNPKLAEITWNSEGGPLLVCKTLGMGSKARESAIKKEFNHLPLFADKIAKRHEGPYHFQPHEDPELERIDNEYKDAKKRLQTLKNTQESTQWEAYTEKEIIAIKIQNLNQRWTERCVELQQKRNKKEHKNKVTPNAYKYLVSSKK